MLKANDTMASNWCCAHRHDNGVIDASFELSDIAHQDLVAFGQRAFHSRPDFGSPARSYDRRKSSRYRQLSRYAYRRIPSHSKRTKPSSLHVHVILSFLAFTSSLGMCRPDMHCSKASRASSLQLHCCRSIPVSTPTRSRRAGPRSSPMRTTATTRMIWLAGLAPDL